MVAVLNELHRSLRGTNLLKQLPSTGTIKPDFTMVHFSDQKVLLTSTIMSKPDLHFIPMYVLYEQAKKDQRCMLRTKANIAL